MENETIKKMNKLESKIAKISQMERKLCYPDHLKNIDIPLALKEAAEKTDMLRKMVEENSFSYLSETIEAMDEVVKSPTFQAATKHISDNKKLLEDISSSGYMESAIAMEQALKQFETSPLFSHITKICSVFPPDVIDEYSLLFEQMSKKLPIDSTNSISSSDIFKIDISVDGSLTYEGETFSKAEFIETLQTQKDEVENHFSQRSTILKIYTIMCTILMIYTRIPDLVEATLWYRNLVEPLYEIAMDIPQMCYTIKEKSYLRSEANAKSNILAILVYDTELKILEDIPRWYKVKYIDETGTEIEGWISKISVED